MKCKILALILLMIIFSIPASAQWADSTLNYRSVVSIPDGVRPYQLSLNISNSIGKNNATYLFCNGHCNINFTDVRFYLDNSTLLNYWIENNTTGKIWINVTQNGSVSAYYGNSTKTSLSNGNATFPFFDDFPGSSIDTTKWTGSTANTAVSNSIMTLSAAIGQQRYLNGNIALPVNHAVDSRIKFSTTPGGSDELFGFGSGAWSPAEVSGFYSASGTYSISSQHLNVSTTSSSSYTIGSYTRMSVARNGTTGTRYEENFNQVTNSPINTNVPTGDLPAYLHIGNSNIALNVDWIFIHTFLQSGAPAWATWGDQESFLISSWGNNYTNDNTLNFSISANTYINFNITNTSRADSFAWYFNGVNQSANFNNTSILINSPIENNITVYVFNGSNVSSLSWFVTLPFQLLTPANGSTITANYPPRDEEVNFSWYSVGFPYYELIISRSPDFALIVSDTYTTATSKNISLPTGSYWWRVRNYDSVSGTWGAYSTTFNFTLSLSSSATGKGIDGVVYEIVSGNYQPIDQATVYIYNNTWSSLQVTGTNGYYLFSPLANGTYNIYATKNGYDTTAAFPVSVNGSVTTNDILMKIYISPYVPNFVFEKFIVRDLFDRSYIGVTVNVYKGDSPIVSFTGTTDSTGSAVFQLIKDQRYRVTFTGGGISGTITIYVYAKEESYFVRVLNGFPTGGDRYTDIQTNLTSIQFDATTTNLTLIYNDTKSSTSIINFYVLNLSTNVACYQTNTTSIATLSCNVPMSGTYQFGFNATSSVYGFFQEDKIINFDVGKPATPSVTTNVDSDLLQWASIILIVLTAALFSIRTVKYGAVIVPLEALALWAFGWFEPMANNSVGSFLLLSCAVVIGVMIYLRSSEVKVNF